MEYKKRKYKRAGERKRAREREIGRNTHEYVSVAKMKANGNMCVGITHKSSIYILHIHMCFTAAMYIIHSIQKFAILHYGK